jgi:hypothetical protein
MEAIDTADVATVQALRERLDKDMDIKGTIVLVTAAHRGLGSGSRSEVKQLDVDRSEGALGGLLVTRRLGA